MLNVPFIQSIEHLLMFDPTVEGALARAGEQG
jgi:hypothetical protein